MKYKYLPYDSSYPSLYEEEERRILEFLPVGSKIEHFGSTSIPGVGGKGIIDIYVCVPKDKLDETKDLLETLGYIYKETNPRRSFQGRMFFSRIEEKSSDTSYTYHLHLSYLKSPDFEKAIAFRDYLRAHPKEASEYDKIKKKAVDSTESFETVEEKKEAYMNTKQPFIEKIQQELKMLS